MAKTSKFRHARAQAAKPDSHFLNVSPTTAIWDCGNFMACNSKYIAVPWHLNGSTAVLRHDQRGKLPSSLPVLTGHAGPVIDLTFSPFDDDLLFTGSEDATIRGWRIPTGGLTGNDVAPVVELKGHSKKVGILSFHPSAENVLASASMDNSINLWDVTVEAPKATLKGFTNDQILSLNWNLDGSMLNVTTRDKKLSILDSRSGAVVATTESHQGSKNQRSVWAKRKNLIVTVGFDKSQRREVMVWDCRNLTKAIKAEEIDQASSVMMPFYDEDTSMLYIGSKGDGTIRYYELTTEAPILLACSTYASADPAKGLAIMPKRCLDVKQCEIARFYFLGQKSMYPLRMILPRKQSEVEFQEDVFVPTFAAEPAIKAVDFFDGKKNAEPKVMDLRGLFDGTACSVTSSQAAETSSTATPSAAAAAPSNGVTEKDDASTAAEVPVQEPQSAAFSPIRHDSPAVDSADVEEKRQAVLDATQRVSELRASLAAAEEDLQNKQAALQALLSLGSQESPAE